MSEIKQIWTAQKYSDLEEIAGRLLSVPIPHEGLDIFARKHKVWRTIPQNSRLWLLHNLYAAHINRTWPERAARMIGFMELHGVTFSPLGRKLLLGRIWSAQDAHEEFKKRYLGGKSSTKASKLEMMELQTRYEADLATEEGIQLEELSDENL